MENVNSEEAPDVYVSSPFISFTSKERMNGVLGLDAGLIGYTRLGTTWANEMNFGVSSARSAGLSI